MATQTRTNIKNVLKDWPRNTVITARGMLKLGISRDLQRYYVKSGWLESIGRGAYTMLGENVSLDGALYTLQTDLGLSVHQGGYSALSEKYGKTHNVPYARKTQLFAQRGKKLPPWLMAKYGTEFDLYYTSFCLVILVSSNMTWGIFGPYSLYRTSDDGNAVLDAESS